jgi:pimeloyl-ACP methyl ester carboxylesterase
MTPETQAIAMQNARFFRAATLSVDHSPDLDKKKVAKLPMPVLLVSGEKTKPMLKQIVDELARVLPSAERVVIKDAGHGSPRERPVQFTEALMSFLSRNAIARK